MDKEQIKYKLLNLPNKLNLFLIVLSFFIVAFGQPARSPFFGILAACFGYALFWRALLSFDSFKSRFILSTCWFTAVQLFQLSWMISHPYYYILAPYFLFSLLIGLQFAFLSLLVSREHLFKMRTLIGISSLWVLMEWSRLFFLSGYSWNPTGMALTSTLYSLQMASLFGIFGLSFWVMFANLLFLRGVLLLESNLKATFTFSLFVMTSFTPYLYGAFHFAIHEKYHQENESKGDDFFNAVLVQPAFSLEELDSIADRNQLIHHVMDQWKQILHITKKQKGKKIDLLVLPEYVVPFGTYTMVFPLDYVKNIFSEVFGEEILVKLPPLETHLAQKYDSSEKNELTFVNNAFWLQSLANIFESAIVAGLEDVDHFSFENRNYYSAALYFSPACTNCLLPERYEKRVLVPLGEYIPFNFCRQLARNYGVTGSFTKGEKAKIFYHPKKPFGVSICYEETFGNVMRENRQGGAELLVNLTNDGWFPKSLLTKQHFDHARLRSVECGIPLMRACNTGITGGFDSLGRIVSLLEPSSGNESIEERESLSDSLYIQMPTYTYLTPYSQFGDSIILLFSCLALSGLAVSSFSFRR